MGVSTLWGIREIYAEYSGNIHRVYVCIGYVSGMYRVCIGKVSKGTGRQKDYEVMRSSMIHGTAPAWTKLIEQITILQEQCKTRI
jgi:hypothetical protein